MPATSLPQCEQCGIILGADALNTAAPVPCPSCGTRLQAYVFPALFRASEAGRGGENVEGGADGAAAVCFFHPGKRAVTPCSECGRFLCGLCDLDFNADGRHLCSECLRVARIAPAAGRMPELENHRVFHDRLALGLSVLPLLVWPLTLFTAPAALFLALRSWRSVGLGPVPRSRVPLVFAALFSSAQVLAWAAGGVYLLSLVV